MNRKTHPSWVGENAKFSEDLLTKAHRAGKFSGADEPDKKVDNPVLHPRGKFLEGNLEKNRKSSNVSRAIQKDLSSHGGIGRAIERGKVAQANGVDMGSKSNGRMSALVDATADQPVPLDPPRREPDAEDIQMEAKDDVALAKSWQKRALPTKRKTGSNEFRGRADEALDAAQQRASEVRDNPERALSQTRSIDAIKRMPEQREGIATLRSLMNELKDDPTKGYESLNFKTADPSISYQGRPLSPAIDAPPKGGSTPLVSNTPGISSARGRAWTPGSFTLGAAGRDMVDNIIATENDMGASPTKDATIRTILLGSPNKRATPRFLKLRLLKLQASPKIPENQKEVLERIERYLKTGKFDKGKMGLGPAFE